MYSRLCAEREAAGTCLLYCCRLTLHVGGGILDTRVPQNKKPCFVYDWLGQWAPSARKGTDGIGGKI